MTADIPKLSIGFSPCPNDTFIFHALTHGLAGEQCPGFFEALLEDVETLNEWALRGKLDVTKLSFHALGHVLDDYVLLAAGSALGRGCGPLVVARQAMDPEELGRKKIAVPGRYTTAAMLLRLFVPACQDVVAMRFERIMPSIAAGEVDAGIVIHESRFVYQRYGLVLLRDLGAWWEDVSGFPVPLGGIVARRSLGNEVIHAVERCIRASVRRALARPEECISYVRQHAQELDDRVVREHIGLYVNSYSENLGEEGLAAVRAFLRRGRDAGILFV